MLLRELVAALPSSIQARVQSIPLGIDDTPGEVNAFAACDGGAALMIVTDGLLQVAAFLSVARANDEIFGTGKVDEYIAFVSQRIRRGSPIPSPPDGFFISSQETDPRRVARQHDVFDELVGFVLGHELAHHHLGHLPCTGGSGPFGMGGLTRDLSRAVPLFNQPNEMAADTAGTYDLLSAGAHRTGYRLSESGALLLMRFFSAIDQVSPTDLLLAFDRTHPPPPLRIPLIQQTANLWRLSGGAWVPVPTF